MTRNVNALAAALAVIAAVPARAQVQNALDRLQGVPGGMALPVSGAAAAEEPSALTTNPAGVGFVDDLALQYFHEEEVTPGSRADGIFLADRLGPLGFGYAAQWIRPGEIGLRRYRKTTLALGLGDGRSSSIAFAWNRFASPDGALDRLSSWSVGATVRPSRRLSIAVATLDRDARVGDVRLPARYDLGVATRLWDDGLTLSADLIADDRARDDFRATHLAFGAGTELRFGLGVSVQVQVPIVRAADVDDRVSTVFALAWNGPHGGWIGGASAPPGRTGWLAGVRLSSERYRAAAAEHEVPSLDLDDELSPPRTLFFPVGERDPYGALLRRLEAAGKDPDVAAVVLGIEGLPIGGGRIEELRALVADIRARKPVLAYVVGGGTREYWLASAATGVAAPPGATLFVNGLATSQLFLRDALARLGVTFEVAKAGAYKSAPEALVRSGSSPEAREALNAIMDDVFARIVADVAVARKLPEERVRALVDQGLFTSEEAKTAGLVDEVLWPDELDGWARKLTGRRVHVGGRYRPDEERRAQRWGKPAVIEIVRLEGTITSGKSRRDPLGGAGIAGADSVAGEIRRAADDRDVKAIVLRIDSPGGDGLASDLIWREVVRARRRKPVVASMGDVAASGGYLVAVGADAIFAEPSTITGSIGVFALKPDLSGLLQKLSVPREAYARGENAQLRSVAKPWSAAERNVVERQVDAFYRVFVDRVAEGRKLARAEVEAVAGGRVWTGRQAMDRRLVDRLGSLGDAIALARERARLGPGAFVEIRTSGAGTSRLAALAGGVLARALPEPPLSAALSSIPELGALSLLAHMGPLLALPEEWVIPE